MSKTKSTAPATSSDAPAVRPGPTYRARPRRREFLCTVAADETLRPAGFGLTLDAVIADLVGNVEGSIAEGRLAVNDEGRDDPRDRDDEVIWEVGPEGCRVLAVLRPTPDGLGLEVVRFDDLGPEPPAESPPVPAVAEGQDDEGDDDEDDEVADPIDVPPARAPRPSRIEPPPLPLARATMTFNSPSEPGFLTSIEVAVYDQCLEGQANTAAELGQAGWSVHSLGSMTIASRTAC